MEEWDPLQLPFAVYRMMQLPQYPLAFTARWAALGALSPAKPGLHLHGSFIHGMLQAEGDVRHAVTNLQQELQQLKEVRQCRAEQQKQQVGSSLCSKNQKRLGYRAVTDSFYVGSCLAQVQLDWPMSQVLCFIVLAAFHCNC